MNTFDAIFSRRSIRHFKHEKIEWEAIADLLEYADKLPALIPGIAIEFKLVSNIEEKQGFSSPFNIKAPYYLCISSEEKEDYLLNAGYLIQQIDLYLVSKGYGTCYSIVSPGRRLKAAMKYKFVIALAFGITGKSPFRDKSEAKRLSEDELIVYKEEVSEDVKKVLEAARLAPSLNNTQPWRFVVYRNRIHVFAKKNQFVAKLLDYNKMIDMGIMMANLMLTAEELWVDLKMTKSDALKAKPLQNNEYVCTLVIG